MTFPLPVLLLMGAASAGEPRRQAVVVGIERYESLPATARAEGARNDAARVAGALESAGYTVRLLTDASATRSALRTLLETDVGPALTSQDLFQFVFVGLGVGGDFGEPRLLFYDTDPASLAETSWSTADLGADLTRWIHAGSILVATDAIHGGNLNDLALIGPSASDWPDLGRSAVILSASAPKEPSVPGVFAKVFTEALAGAADAGADGRITSGELARWLVTAVPQATGDRQHPVVDARYDPSILLVAPATSTASNRIDKVKFVFKGGISPSVSCAGAAPVACDPSCYVWDVVPGVCEVSAVYAGERRSTRLDVLQRGRWMCGEGVNHAITCHE